MECVCLKLSAVEVTEMDLDVDQGVYRSVKSSISRLRLGVRNARSYCLLVVACGMTGNMLQKLLCGVYSNLTEETQGSLDLCEFS